MKTLLKTLLCMALALTLVAALNGCGGGTQAGAGSGRVALLLTDGPSAQFDEVNVTLTAIRLLSDERQVTVFAGSRTVNLLELGSHAELFSFVDAVPAGVYDKIRLSVQDVTLVRYQGQGSDALYSGESDDLVFHPRLPGHKIDLNPRGAFVVTAGETLYLQFDVDADKSLKITTTGSGGYIFRPVIFVTVAGQDTATRLVRVSGTVRSPDATTHSFYLCDTGLDSVLTERVAASDHGDDDVYDDDYSHSDCVYVREGDGVAYVSASGEAATFAGLLDGETATVLGHIGADHDDDDDHYLKLRAALVELAAPDVYRRITGSVATDHDAGSFTLQMDPGQLDGADNPITVELIPGARIFALSGAALPADAILAGRLARVEGLPQLSDSTPDLIRAALVLLDTPEPTLKLSGDVTAVGAPGFIVADSATGDRCVAIDAGSELYGLSVESATSLTSRVMTLPELAAGSHVEVYGDHWSDGCLVAKVVLVTL